MRGETLGKLSVPLLRINNEEKRWYALKDRSKKSNAKGNCPRILLQMSVVWNPVSCFNFSETFGTKGALHLLHLGTHVGKF